MIHDRVTTVGSVGDASVRRLSTEYEVRGMPSTLTSFDDPDVGEGNVVNQVAFAYNAFGQPLKDQQSHSGAVNAMTTPSVQYQYANGTANTIRPTGMVYPNGRNLGCFYGDAGGIDDAASRVLSLLDDDNSSIVRYDYLGLGTPVIVDYPEPDLEYTLVGTTGGDDPDTGDIYRGLDRFGRVKDAYWYSYGDAADAARIHYGYDRASNRIWRKDPVAESYGKHFDELYAYDGLHRLKEMQRGELNSGKTAITNETFAQCWSLDSTGNWAGMREADTGGSWTLEQSRTANRVNEISGITNATGPAWAQPNYDPAGNMTTIPKPKLIRQRTFARKS